jgi:hypothetical protein
VGVYYRQGNLDYGVFNTHSNFSQKLDKDQISGEIILLANAMFYKQHGTILEIIFAFLQKQVTFFLHWSHVRSHHKPIDVIFLNISNMFCF